MKEDGFDNNPYLNSLQKFGSKENSLVIPICNKIEAEMNEFSESEKQEFLESMGMSEPGLNKVITSGYNILNLHTYFTAGPNELRAWTIKKMPPHLKLQEKYTPILRRVSYERRLSISMTILHLMASKAQKTPASGA